MTVQGNGQGCAVDCPERNPTGPHPAEMVNISNAILGQQDGAHRLVRSSGHVWASAVCSVDLVSAVKDAADGAGAAEEDVHLAVDFRRICSLSFCWHEKLTTRTSEDSLAFFEPKPFLNGAILLYRMQSAPWT